MAILRKAILLAVATAAYSLLAVGAWAQEYVLGPEDVLTLKVARHDELGVESLVVLPDGTISVPRGGTVQVGGLTLSKAQEAVTTALKKVLIAPQVTLSVKAQRPNRIYVIGQVGKPGTFDLKPGWRLMEALAEAGDLKNKPELARAVLRRGDGTIIDVDLVGLLIRHDPAANLELKPLDILDIRDVPTHRIWVNGRAVKAPNQFDVPSGTTVIQALALAGGLTVKPELARCTVTHADGSTQPIDLNALINHQDPKLNLVLRPNDVLAFEEEATSHVFVSGPGVKTPGTYDVTEGLGLVQILTMAGGYTPNAALRSARVMRAPKDGKPGEEIPVDLYGTLVKGDPAPDIQLGPDDTLFIPELTGRISVYGVVKSAGSFPLPEKEGFGVADAIALAGGTDKRADLVKVTVVRRVGAGAQPTIIKANMRNYLRKGDMTANVPLQDGDTVYVPESGRPDFFGQIIPALSSLSIFSYYLKR